MVCSVGFKCVLFTYIETKKIDIVCVDEYCGWSCCNTTMWIKREYNIVKKEII